MYNFEDFTYSYGGSSITLHPFVLEPTDENPRIMGANMRIDVTEVINFPTGVFMWERILNMEDDNSSSTSDRVLCVAKPGDLGTYPMDNPSASIDLPFFRAAWFAMVIASPELLVDTWDNIKSDVSGLLKSVVDLGGV